MSPRLTFDRIHHRYTLDGVVVPSVTTVLARAGLTRWRGELSDPAAMQRGTEVHRWCARYELDAAPLTEIPNACRGYVASWAEAKAALGLVVDEVERIVYSVTYRYAGRLDWIGADRAGRRTIVDWKSGPPGPEAALQIAAYDLAYREREGHQTPCLRFALHLQADGRIARVTEYTGWQDASRFLAALTVVQCQQAFGLIATEDAVNGHIGHAS